MMRKTLLNAFIVSMSLGLAACGSDSDSNNDNNNTNTGGDTDNGYTATATQVTVDATAGGFGAAADDPANKHTYFSFSTGAVVELSDAEAASSNAWDVAFKRTNITINSANQEVGAEAALVGAQADFYDAEGAPVTDVFVNATALSEREDFVAVTADTLGDAEFQKDGDKEVLADAWYSYNGQTHQVTANPANAWIIRNAEKTKVAVFNVTSLVQNQFTAGSITAEFLINEAAEGEAYDFADTAVEFTADFTGGDTEVCYDIDTQSALDCASNADTWDVRFDAGFDIWLNGGVHGDGDAGAFGPLPVAQATAMTVAPNFFADSTGGVFSDSSTYWYAYSLQGNHKLWPNYRVYVVKANGEQYKMRVMNYYAPADSTDPAPGTSGVVTFEYEKL